MTRYLEIKPGSISETIKRLSDDYKAIFKKELEKTGKGIGSMTPDEKKAFFNKIDKMHNAKNEAIAPVKPDESKTTLVAAPGNKEKVIRIPKEKLADYKAKGYVEAESYIPEAKKVKEEELTAGQKKLPPALQKAIEKKDKKEEVKLTEDKDVFHKGKKVGYVAKEGGKFTAYYDYDDPKDPQPGETNESKEGFNTEQEAIQYIKSIQEEVKLEDKDSGGIDALRAIKGKRLRLQGELDALNKDDANYKEKAANLRGQIEKQKEIMASKQKEVYGSYDPSREDALDLNEGDLEEACWTGYKKIGMKKKGDRMVPNCIPEEYVTESGDIVEFVELDEGQFKQIDIRKGDLKIAKDKKQALKDKYNAIMAGQASGDENSIADQIQKLDMSIKKQEQELIDIMKKSKETKSEEVETVEEAAGPDRLTNLNDKITKLQVNISKLDMSKPENKTKEAIMKADLTTAKLRLQDVIQKKNTETKKESVNEAKKTYKSIKKSVKKEQDKEVNSKRTLTDKPLTKVDVDPKIEN